YFAGWPSVAMSISPARAPPAFWSVRRAARPIVALARLPGPKALEPLFIPIAEAMGPLTMTHTVAEPVVVAMPSRLNSGAVIASTAAPTTGRYAGAQPASTALIATSRHVTSAYA